jgi:hypothetical protein
MAARSRDWQHEVNVRVWYLADQYFSGPLRPLMGCRTDSFCQPGFLGF